MFADDTLVAVEDSSIDGAILKMNTVLKKLEIWMGRNNVVINTKKTKVMVLGQHFPTCADSVRLNNDELEFVNVVKYLGVTIDRKLEFKNHIGDVVGAARKRVGYFSRVCKYVSVDTRVMIYKALVSPLFEYCPTILFYASEGDLQRLQLLQNKAMRCILGCGMYVSVDHMLDVLCFLNIRDRLYVMNMCFIHKIVSGQLPRYLSVTRVSDVHDYNTRTRNDLYIKRVRHTYTQNCLFFNGFAMYNLLDDSIKDSINVREFKRKMLRYVRS